jgi:hypothetical protein
MRANGPEMPLTFVHLECTRGYAHTKTDNGGANLSISAARVSSCSLTNLRKLPLYERGRRQYLLGAMAARQVAAALNTGGGAVV